MPTTNTSLRVLIVDDNRDGADALGHPKWRSAATMNRRRDGYRMIHCSPK